jgi:beta-fructofuranosidase
MVATSTDLVTWEKTGATIAVPQEGYDPTDWRDPWVVFDEENQQWVMILGTRKAGPKTQLTGSTVYFTSTDHETWEFQGDFWAPEQFTMHEMPDVFREGDWWYHLITEYSDKSKTIYRRSRSLFGPWEEPEDDAFDGRAYYAARSFSDGERRYLFGWVATRWDDDDTKLWQWGGTLVVHEIVVREDGTLGTKIPDGVLAHLGATPLAQVAPFALERADGLAQQVLAQDVPSPVLVSTTISVTPGTKEVGLRFAEDLEANVGYRFSLIVDEGRLEFEKRPNWPWGQVDNRGIERPLPDLVDGGEHTLQLVLDADIATLYVDDVALNTRFDAPAGSALVLDVVSGSVQVGSTRVTSVPQQG